MCLLFHRYKASMIRQLLRVVFMPTDVYTTVSQLTLCILIPILLNIARDNSTPTSMPIIIFKNAKHCQILKN